MREETYGLGVEDMLAHLVLREGSRGRYGELVSGAGAAGRMRREERPEDWSERAEVGRGARTFEVLGVVVECGVSTVRVVVLS